MEENLSPALSFQNELNFTKCAQAVGAVKDVLSAACKNQWDHLQGKGIDGLNFQETEEGLCSPSSSARRSPRHPPSSPRRWEVLGVSCERWPLSHQLWKPPARLCCTLHNPCLGLCLVLEVFMNISTETGEATNRLGVRQGPVGGGKWPKWPPMKGDSFFPG